jgi:tetratricopeptide (TPR) repeat protein
MRARPSQPRPLRIPILAILLAIAAASFAVHLPAIDNQFFNWDDDLYVTSNSSLRSLQPGTLWNLFFEDPYLAGNYHPLTMISLAIDFRVAGANPRHFHLINVALHTLNALLVFWFIWALIALVESTESRAPYVDRQSTGSWKLPLAVIVSTLFGIHTLHVESVAWISQRKDLLFALFFFAASIAYVRYLESGSLVAYSVTLLCFLMSLLSKAMAVSLAPTLLAIDYAAHRPLRSLKVTLEKLPFFILAILFGILAIRAQALSGALGDEAAFTLFERLALASYALTQYLLKLLAPLQLSVFYPYPAGTGGGLPPHYWLFLLVPLGAAAALFLAARRSKVMAFAILFFLINLALVLQIVPVGSAIMADRYAYLPSMGFFLLVAALCGCLTRWIPRILLTSALLLYGAGLACLTYQRSDVWQDSLTLWDDALSKYAHAPAAWNGRASARRESGDLEGAISDYDNAVRLRRHYFEALSNRGVAKKDLGLIDEAIADFDRALDANPLYDVAYANRANARRIKGDLEGAIRDYDRAISLNPSGARSFSNRGVTRMNLGDLDGAIDDLAVAVRLLPDFADAHYNLGDAYLGKRDFGAAIESYGQAIALRPDDHEAHARRASACEDLKRAARRGVREAAETYSKHCR